MAITKGTMTIGILAILSGLLAAYGVRSLLVKKEVPAKPAPPVIRVPLASADLPSDRVIAAGDVSIVEMTQERFRERFKGTEFTLIMMLDKNIIGRRLGQPLNQGQPFLTTALYLEGTGPSLAEKLPPGFRAISLQVSDTHGGNAQPGTYIDVVFRAQARPARGFEPAIPEMTVTLLRHIQVLEVNRAALRRLEQTRSRRSSPWPSLSRK